MTLPSDLQIIGNARLFERANKLAFFCSNRCPGSIILKVQDWANALTAGVSTDADASIDAKVSSDAIIPMSGFHTPIEREVLRILLRAKHPLIIFPARNIDKMKIPREWHEGIEAGTIAIASDLPSGATRITARTAHLRNRLLAACADKIVIAHAAPSSKTHVLATDPQWRHKITPLF